MEEIIINKDGRITSQAAGKSGKIKGPVLGLLGNQVELSRDFCLASFFEMIKIYPEYRQISPMLDALLEIYEKARDTKYKSDEIDGLVFYKTIEVVGFPGTPSLKIYTSLKGTDRDETKKLKFFHIETLLDHVLTLGTLKHVVFGDTEDVFQYETIYTLFEFIEGIAWELSFNFNPLQCSIRR